MDRRDFLQLLAAAPVAAGLSGPLAAKDAPAMRLIAHRGGVVDDAHPENSPASLEAAIEQGYWMAEVDVRRTRDGCPILQHDATFQRFYGDPRKVLEMDWSEIRQLRATPGGSRPMLFEELTERCKGRMRLMLDVKNEPNQPEYYQAMERALMRNDLMESTYILTDVETERYFQGRIPGAANGEALRAAAARGEALPRAWYLFEGADTITREAIDLARLHGLDAIAAVNTFHYRGDDAMTLARKDLQKAYGLGVRTFQIDSVYRPLCEELGGDGRRIR
ncbi:glycerophosphodiester phosphodiesterase family protein [Sphingomonas sp. dw_22]|uniref:glycerophosphodiester phosphodiesterase n=1 Tax=Sphingomonas sp. dw_22 TaxID=2721175 RepID=UPI001BD2687A|nr:glycerophosphodiester phosphodiesterase family protein [Sphingomonas sp. dw_22]